MSGARISCGTDHLVDEVGAFAVSITPSTERWRYASKAGAKQFFSKWHGRHIDGVNQKAVPALARLLGVKPWVVKSRLGRTLQIGFDEALFYAAEFDREYAGEGRILRPYFAVGAMPAWCCGHVYFARVDGFPHVLKIGFSRRVRERLDDISAKHRISLHIPDRDHLKVGTQADEHWWHANWARYQIDGEWFFDPKSVDRSLPDFLAENAKREAA